MEILNGNSRKGNSNHEGRKIRRKGNVPGNLYGKERANLLFEIGELELNKGIYGNGDHGLLKIAVDGCEHSTLIKEIQRDPVNNKIIHIDLEEISDTKRIVTEVPLLFTGEENVIQNGGILQKEKNSVKVQCKAENLPKGISVDLSRLRIGDTYRIMDLEFSSEITFMEDINSVIVAVTHDNIRVSEEEINASIGEG